MRDAMKRGVCHQLGPDGKYQDPREYAIEQTKWILANHQPEPLDADRGRQNWIASWPQPTRNSTEHAAGATMTCQYNAALEPIAPAYHLRILDDTQLQQLKSATLECPGRRSAFIAPPISR